MVLLAAATAPAADASAAAIVRRAGRPALLCLAWLGFAWLCSALHGRPAARRRRQHSARQNNKSNLAFLWLRADCFSVPKVGGSRGGAAPRRNAPPLSGRAAGAVARHLPPASASGPKPAAKVRTAICCFSGPRNWPRCQKPPPRPDVREQGSKLDKPIWQQATLQRQQRRPDVTLELGTRTRTWNANKGRPPIRADQVCWASLFTRVAEVSNQGAELELACGPN